ncbi:MAG: FkbM family methyltransferase [Chloroflexota bacterium]|nr:FkbM family methyltransferase [Chloroflexota bacterium]MDE2910719.1 FkbM family methyltransferase [Chloroflexota bacterium]
MRALDASLKLYRKTLKRIQPAHVAMHRLMGGLILPGLERALDFKTIADDPFWFRLELLTGQHESETRRALERLAAPGMIALDIGAHVGYHSRLLARQVGAAGRVIALEPHPRTFKALRHNTRDLPNATALQLAASEAEGSAELHDYLMMSASGSLHYDETLARQQRARMGAGDVAPRRDGRFEPQRYRVRTVAIDDCLTELGIARVDIVKMDIEGAELAALRGMRRTIAASPGLALVMEYNPSALGAFGHEPAAALDEARALGFGRVEAIAPDGSLIDWGDAALVQRETARLLAGMGVVNLLLRK